MAKSKQFQHLPLPFVERGAANIHGGGSSSNQTKNNRDNRGQHSQTISGQIKGVTKTWTDRLAARPEELPEIPPGIAFVLEIDPKLDIEKLREYFAFEIVAEEGDGFVIVASEDIDLEEFLRLADGFATELSRSATIASIYRLDDDEDQTARLQRILSEGLFAVWPTMDSETSFIVDIGVVCVGKIEIPDQKKKGKRDTDQTWAVKQREWNEQRLNAYQVWDDLKDQRESEVINIVHNYDGEILSIIDGEAFDVARLPDSFTMRIRVEARGLRDLVLNYPFIFEVCEPDDIELPQHKENLSDEDYPRAELNAPAPTDPTVCVIDSGIQEAHLLLEPAVDSDTSHSYLPNNPSVADEETAGGHGTRVAGAVLFGEEIPKSGTFDPNCWVQNARVLDASGHIPESLFPPALLEAIVERFHKGARATRIFNQSINSVSPCRTRRMSAWAAAIDMMCFQNDILLIQSAGNVMQSNHHPANPGLQEHVNAGRQYPNFLMERSFRIANPGQSFQAITVGSVSYAAFDSELWKSFSRTFGSVSSFSRCGFGIWGVTKPDVVEFGGDCLISSSNDVSNPTLGKDCYPELIRSTLHGGPLYDRDTVGTSFATPKVTKVAAALQRVLPNEPCLLYRALIIQSARWPEWAYDIDDADEKCKVMRMFGFGIPSLERATENTEYRSTVITQGEQRIHPKEAKIFQIPIPIEMRQPGDDFDVQIEVTLSYVAQPRRTRRHRRRYLSTWLDWKTSNLGEPIGNFRRRALKDTEKSLKEEKGTSIPWAIMDKRNHGILGVGRSSGTVQKDWAVVKSNQLPEDFCVAVLAHGGWSNDPETEAKFALAVSFEAVNEDLKIHEHLEVSIGELQAELHAGELEL